MTAEGARTVLEVDGTGIRDVAPDAVGSGGRGLGGEDGARVTARDCTIERAHEVGVSALDPGTQVELEACLIADTRPSLIYAAALGVVARRGTVTTNRLDVTSGGGPGSADDYPYAAVWLAAAGQYTLRDSELRGGPGVEISPGVVSHGNAVYASGLESGELVIERCVLTGARDAAILLDNAAATLSEASWSDNGVDVVQQRCQEIDVLLDATIAPSSEICTGEDRLVDELEFRIYLDGQQPASVRPPPR